LRAVYHVSGREKNHDLFYINRYSDKTQKVFGYYRIGCSIFTGNYIIAIENIYNALRW